MKFRKRKDMTKLTLKNARIVSRSGEEGMYGIVLTCPLRDVSGQILKVDNLEVEIKSKEDGHRD